MTWPTNEAYENFIRSLLVLKEVEGDNALHILQQEAAREAVIAKLRKAQQPALPAPEAGCADTSDRAEKLAADRAIAIEALEFYTDQDNWSGKNSAAQRDKGKRALAALAEITDREDGE